MYKLHCATVLWLPFCEALCCPGEYKVAGGICVYPSLSQRNFNSANSDCNSRSNGYLVTIDTSTKQNSIVSTLDLLYGTCQRPQMW